VSNYSLRRWQAADAALGLPVLSNQVRYSLVDRRPEAQLLPWAQANDRLVIAYSPLGQGLLSARYDAENRPGGVRAANALFLPENLARAGELLDVLRGVASAHDATPAQVALAWVIRRPNVVAIPGASSVVQLERNAEAADLELTDQEDEQLTAASGRFSPVAGMPAFVGMARERFRRAS
jgi:aryl-alcohol dehydrogenase-like predicted oxidoreductase